VRKLLALSVTVAAIAAAEVKHVVVFGVDGLSAKAVDREHAPNMRKLMDRGVWTLRARAVLPTVSSPNWAAMIMGAGSDFTGITSNEWQPDKFEIAPFCHDGANHPPTIFGLIQRTGSAGLFTDWADFVRLVEPLPAVRKFAKEGDAPEVVRQAIGYLRTGPALTFIHVDNVDHAGHTAGWYTPQYSSAVHDADAWLGEVVQAIGAAGETASTIVLVTADHGGHGTKHGDLVQSDIEIPWIAAGPGLAINREIKSPVSIAQTAPTIAAWLGIAPHECWVARPVAAAMSEVR
jgi:predicted AlkP superfamily pyrophosphatase or phosphodiesterase